MSIGEIVKVKQPYIYEKLNNKIDKRRRGRENDFKNMMKRSCYRRGRGGAVRQVK